MRAKYNATKVEYDGIKFDSKLECNVYKVLSTRLWGYVFKGTEKPLFKIILQMPYCLQEKFTFNGKVIRPIVYKCDFLIQVRIADSIVRDMYVIDAKGMETNEFKLKKKLFLFKYHKEITIIKSMKQANEFCDKILEENKENLDFPF